MISPTIDPAFEQTPPEAASLVESLRSFGYDLSRAIADLIDNSITASARNVWVDFFWNGAESTITVTDDGCGMTEEQVRRAMRLGSTNPLLARDPQDLGRFGLGLKTASFSQCRRLSVRTKTADETVTDRCWDLDYIAQTNNWLLLRTVNADCEAPLRRVGTLNTGTAVVWQSLDRLVAGNSVDNDHDQQTFLRRADEVRTHLAMVFHARMIGRDRVRISINDRELEPWDPFVASEPATQILPETKLHYKGAVVVIQPFVLPHHSKLSAAKHGGAAGPRGWNAHQGFYVYRNRRLLVAGDWLGLGWTKEEHYKLARIKLEIPNSLDHDWHIDVTKSKAAPPAALRPELRQIGEVARAQAKKVYMYRGAQLTSGQVADRVFLWNKMARHDKVFFRLNRAHPLVLRALESTTDKAALNSLLRLVEESVPVPMITIQNSERPDSIPSPFEGATESQIHNVMREVFDSLVASGHDRRSAAEHLRTYWPFELFPELVAAFIEDD